MLKNYKHYSIIFIFLINVFNLTGQEGQYKEVLLDGKPARLNVATGEITLIEKPKAKPKTLLVTMVIDTIKSKDPDFHIVKAGETLLDISENYEISINKLRKANGLSTTLVDEGDRIRIKNLQDSVIVPSAIKQKNVFNFNSDYHTVKEGETLYSISKRYDIEIEELKFQNDLTSNIIKVGQQIQIRNFDLSNAINSTSIWVVKKGDTLYSISKKTGTTVSKLKHLNGLKNDVIKVGQKLVLK
ncbi:LysM peptidoglycan-binding domain-containing protein [Winogradskyella poriferorum]|uniref:LysM peptidoglycan-binding domain-containing protein n=1 Tax=Winogradskyella poriferorum TaxID=307627 RepID=UPI003D656AF7